MESLHLEGLLSDASLWFLLVFISSLISYRLGISIALIELIIGIIIGNTTDLEITEWVNFLAVFGATMLTFLAGAELEADIIKKFWKASLILGFLSFLTPFLICMGVGYFLLDFSLKAAFITGLALSTTSVAVVYVIVLENGLNTKPIGKLILAVCFVTDVATVVTLGLLFTNFSIWFWLFIGITTVAMVILPKITPLYFKQLDPHISEPEVKYIYFVLAYLSYFAVKGESEVVLPAYLIGMVLANVCADNKDIIRRIRSTTFTFLTPFYFIKAGSLVDIGVLGKPLCVAIIIMFFFLKVIAKFIGIYPVGIFFKFMTKPNIYINLLMSTGLTFGSISALYGYAHGIIDKDHYSMLVLVIILTAIIPTIIAQKYFFTDYLWHGEEKKEEEEKEEECDVQEV